MITNTLQEAHKKCLLFSFFEELPLAKLLEGIWICSAGQKNP